MNFNKDTIIQYYTEKYDEDFRFKKDKAHLAEFLVTKEYLLRFINKDSKILELGAGSGVYTQIFSDLGCDITVTDLVPKHVEILKEKFKNYKNVKVDIANALNLEKFTEKYDVILCMGPLYHIQDKTERLTVIDNIYDRLKPNGYAFFAFCLQDNALVHYVFGNGANAKKELSEIKYDTKTATVVENTNSNFVLNKITDIDDLFKNYNEVFRFAQDGCASIISNWLNDMTEEDYKLFIEYLIATATRPDLMGYSGHIISVIKKN